MNPQLRYDMLLSTLLRMLVLINPVIRSDRESTAHAAAMGQCTQYDPT